MGESWENHLDNNKTDRWMDRSIDRWIDRLIILCDMICNMHNMDECMRISKPFFHWTWEMISDSSYKSVADCITAELGIHRGKDGRLKPM